MSEKHVYEEITAFSRKLLDERLAQLTEPQRKMFHDRVYPKGVPEDRIVSAIDLCDRTIKKNVAGRKP